jgi:uncharacterized protein (DUF4415 family)/uncharacterized DUF497 family protein
MEIEFDPDKEATNVAKHKISLKRGAELDIEDFNLQVRNGERRLQVIGWLDGKLYTLIFVFRRNAVRAISLRRASEEELASMARKKKGFSEDGVPFEREAIVIDDDNPEWTDEVFARSRPASELPPEILAFFPKTLAKLRGPQKAPTKVPVSLRLSREVVEHYKATGDGWQTRIDDALRDLIKKAG